MSRMAYVRGSALRKPNPHRKGLPWRSWLIFTRRHTGVMWPLYFAWPYAKLLVVSPFTAARRRLSPT